MAEKQTSQPPREYAPDEVNQYGEYIKIGGSPIPGLTLRRILRGHTERINRIAWAPDGKYLASPSNDRTIRIWDVESGQSIAIIDDTRGDSVAWSPNEPKIAFASKNGICIWDIPKKVKTETLRTNQLTRWIVWSPDSRVIALASSNRKNIDIWNLKSMKFEKKLETDREVFDLAWIPNLNALASGHGDGQFCVWDIKSGKTLYKTMPSYIISLAIASSNDGTIFAVAIGNEIQIHGITGIKTTIEGHTNEIHSLSFSTDGTILASKSRDNTLRLWQVGTWKNLISVVENTSSIFGEGLRFHPHLPVLATLGEGGTIIRIWELDENILLGQAKENVNYTTAKLVLVGDSGVGKTGLGWRLAHGEFKEHASTHGQQFWAIPQLGKKRQDGVECEAVLWDLAGQHVYRQIHSIFLENVDAALVLFDPSNRQDPLKGAQFWLEQLKGKGQLPPTVLVGARVDRGAPALAQADLDQFCQKYGIKGGYISTSAMTGEGLDELLEIVKAQIPWDEMTATVTTVTFKRIKDAVLALKEKPDRKGVLVSLAQLAEQMYAADPDLQFGDVEIMTAAGHLENHGFVTILYDSSGKQHILLVPELLANLASSIVLLADKHVRELGAVSETDLLQGKYIFDELKGLEQDEQQILIDATIHRFLEHSICFRETLGNETLLIFPGLIKQKRPLDDNFESVDDVSYIVRGRVENIYASLVVLLGYTSTFLRINQWQNQAQYEMGIGEICGFRLIEEREGELELVLYYSSALPDYGRSLFRGLFEKFLYQRDVEVTRFPPVFCSNHHRIERATVLKRVRDGKDFAFCDECGEKTSLQELEKPQMLGAKVGRDVQRAEALAHLRSLYETNLTRIKSFRRDRAAPRCYISQVDDHFEWVANLVHDLRDAGVVVLENKMQLQEGDFILPVCTPAFKNAWDKSVGVPGEDKELVLKRLTQKKIAYPTVIPIRREGKAYNAIPTELQGYYLIHFGIDTSYSVYLFDLVMGLYAIPLNHPAFQQCRELLRGQWEQTLARTEREKENNNMTALKIFISYAHKDEAFKDELITMLAGLQRRGVVDAWVDRRTEAGDDWESDIQNAMDECDLALLLVSPDYLASRYIQEKEQPTLLKRREELKARVIPILVRPCLWLSEPALTGIQGLPRDNKAIITFSKENGDRDKAWMEIAAEIEKRANPKSTP